MDFDENAEITYDPTQDDQHLNEQVDQSDFIEAEKILMNREGVQGVAKTTSAAGTDAILAYVLNEQIIAQLPSQVGGLPVIAEVTGEIKPL